MATLVNMNGSDEAMVVEGCADGVQPAPTAYNVLEVIERVEKWRRSSDIVYRMLTDSDNEVLVQHITGLVQHNDPVGLLYKKYPSLHVARYRKILDSVMASVYDDQPMSPLSPMGQRSTTGNYPAGYHRIVYHFLLFCAMATENEFVTYLVKGVHNRENFRHFVMVTLKGLMTDLLRGALLEDVHNVLSPNQKQCSVKTFVERCRSEYVLQCMPKVVPTMPPE